MNHHKILKISLLALYKLYFVDKTRFFNLQIFAVGENKIQRFLGRIINHRKLELLFFLFFLSVR